MTRRTLLQFGMAMTTLLLFAPLRALAAIWNKLAFEAERAEDALIELSATAIEPSSDIVLVAPQVAENGAVVQIEVNSRIPGTEAIAILVENNPTPLVANFLFFEGTEPYLVTRIKMAETSELKAVVKAGNKYYSASQLVEVAIGGCG